MESCYFDPQKIHIKEIEKPIAEKMIVKYHYTHTWSLCRIAFGVFFDTGKKDAFFDTNDQTLIGCLVFGQPVGRSAAESISPMIKIDEVLELTRLFIFDGYGKNIESYSLTKSLDLLKKRFPNIKSIITYADGEQGHCGIIYQACGFKYQGNSALCLMPNFSISLTNNPYKWLHSRTVFSMYGSHNIEHLKKTIGRTFWRKKESTKHRYVCLLGNKIEKKKILANLKHPFLPYPKSNNYIEEIQEIKVDNEVENTFFG